MSRVRGMVLHEMGHAYAEKMRKTPKNPSTQNEYIKLVNVSEECFTAVL